MQFKPNFPIYLQVADHICEKILTGTWGNGDKIPSVKELSVETSVNPNTVIKSLTWLQDNGILNTQRGVGYFLTESAYENTIDLKRSQFIEEALPEVFSNMKLLDISLEEFQKLYRQQADTRGDK
jgi:DNA-binding transcriptional regulator YhcF (GntR family)